MIQTVAVATDGSETARRAVDAAADLAEHYGAKMVILSAFQQGDLIARDDSTSLELQWSTNPSMLVREILTRLEQDMRGRGLDCTTLLDEGDPADVVTELAARCGADVLVIGNKGMQRRMLGSVPNSVTHKAGCSVLVVKTT